MALPGIETARNSLRTASNNYAKIQNELNKYNKIFEVYSRANPETQQRAASVLRQAIYEYNGLKKQQEENSARIFQAQQYIDYYNRNGFSSATQQTWPSVQSSAGTNGQAANILSAPLEETISVVDVITPGVVNNNTPTLNVEVSENTPVVVSTQTSNSPAKIGMTNYYQTPKSLNVKTDAATNSGSNIPWSNYGPGSTIPMPGTGGIAPLNTTPIYNINRGNNLGETLNDYLRKGAKYVYRFLKK